MNAERRFDRGAWLTLALIIAWAVGFPLVALAAFARPTDGWWTVHDQTGGFRARLNLSQAPSALRVDDLVIAIDGRLILPNQAPPLPSSLQAGQVLHYRVLRQPAPDQPPVAIEVDVPLVVLGPAGIVRAEVLEWQESPREFIVAGLSLLIVAVAFFLRPGNLGARYLLLVFGFYGCAVWLGGFGISDLYAFALPWPLQLAYNLMGPQVWGWYFFPSLTLMALAFPVVKAPLRRFPRLLPAVLYGAPLAATAAAGAGQATGDARWATVLTAAFAVSGLVTIGTIFVTLIHNWISVHEPVARAQLRWLTFGLGAGPGAMFSLAAFAIAQYGRLPEAYNDILWLLLLLPLSIVVAITRYRLWDIDVIIRRTLVYAVLTALLALAYFGSIVVLQNTFSALTGQSQSTLVTVLSTLVIAALFVPLRRRVQAVIDRRLYRRKYDAARTLAAFGAGLRDDVELAVLREHLLRVVDETMQPASAELWLRPGAGAKAPQEQA